jgi:hypothetical protein
MASIPDRGLFCWEDVENLGDLERLKLVLEAIPDESLMRKMERERGNGRDDYPVRAMWNSILAGVVFQHESEASLRRELSRNDRLRWICGFDPLKEAEDVVPDAHNYSRFYDNLFEHQDDIDQIFHRLVEALKEELPDFGRHLAMDSKAIESHGGPKGKEAHQKLARKQLEEGPDRRRDLDADYGVKTYKGRREDGTKWERVIKWFGYKLHLIVDADYELPVGYEVTRASRPDNRSGSRMVEELDTKHPDIVRGCEAAMADKAYDDGKLIRQLYEGGLEESPRRILPIIPKRDDWTGGEKTRPLLEGADNITYDCQGQLYCHCQKTGQRRQMVYWGYEKGRQCQKWRCPAAVYGLQCKGYQRCSQGKDYGRVVRVSREVDRRTFLPVARTSAKFERLYKKRTSVERVNGRLDVSFGFENHYIRGKKKMRARCGLALIVMLAMALGRVRDNKTKEAGEEEKTTSALRSLVGAT